MPEKPTWEQSHKGRTISEQGWTISSIKGTLCFSSFKTQSPYNLTQNKVSVYGEENGGLK